MTNKAHGCHGCQHSTRVRHPSRNVRAGGRHSTGATLRSPEPAPVELGGFSVSTPHEKARSGATGAGEAPGAWRPSDATLLPVLSTLAAHPEGAIVAHLAADLGVSVGLVERRLYSLKRQGLVTAEQKANGGRNKGGEQRRHESHPASHAPPPTLADLGIQKSQAARWQGGWVGLGPSRGGGYAGLETRCGGLEKRQ